MRLHVLPIVVAVLGLSAACALASGAERFWVTNPTSGARLLVQVVRPVSAAPSSPVLVLVPGGRGDSSGFLAARAGASDADLLAGHGFVVVVFDPDGRGESEGVENDDGFVHQDGLAAVIRFAAALEGVDSARVGLVSYSYGVTMATGALARYPDLPILFYIDWEGPANRNDTGGCDAARLGHLKERSCDDEAFWSEREASTFIRLIRVPYQRLQSRLDHVQPDLDHALLLVANATAAEYGGGGQSPWTRLNDLEPNRVYGDTNPPPWPPRDLNLQPTVGDVALELLARFAPQG